MHISRTVNSLLILALLAGWTETTTAHAIGPSMSSSKALIQSTQIGKTMFAPGATDKGGHGQLIDGIEGSSQEMLKTHIHAHLSLFYKGEQIAIPYGIGIVKPFRAENGFVGAGQGYYWLHTHDATGILHIESPDNRRYTLGNFFNIWGEPLSSHNVAGLKGKVRVFVDGKAYAGDPRKIILTPHGQITLEVGRPFVVPPVYVFPQGM
jgi:hypothetical protein